MLKRLLVACGIFLNVCASVTHIDYYDLIRTTDECHVAVIEHAHVHKTVPHEEATAASCDYCCKDIEEFVDTTKFFEPCRALEVGVRYGNDGIVLAALTKKSAHWPMPVTDLINEVCTKLISCLQENANPRSSYNGGPVEGIATWAAILNILLNAPQHCTYAMADVEPILRSVLAYDNLPHYMRSVIERVVAYRGDVVYNSAGDCVNGQKSVER
jgi:hypothetical protein